MAHSELSCAICLDIPTIPMSFIGADQHCKQHYYCVGCLYEYLRIRFQLQSFNGYVYCPLDRISYNLSSQSPNELMNIIEINTDIMQLLNQEEELTCLICSSLNLPSKYVRKDYLEHWKTAHFGKDEHLLSIQNHTTNDNLELLPPELLTQEAIENQQWIQDQIRLDISDNDRIRNNMNKLQRQEVLNKWKELWISAKELKESIYTKDVTIWRQEFQLLKENVIEQNIKKDNLFTIYNYPDRRRTIKENKKKYNDGNLLDYLNHIENKFVCVKEMSREHIGCCMKEPFIVQYRKIRLILLLKKKQKELQEKESIVLLDKDEIQKQILIVPINHKLRRQKRNQNKTELKQIAQEIQYRNPNIHKDDIFKLAKEKQLANKTNDTTTNILKVNRVLLSNDEKILFDSIKQTHKKTLELDKQMRIKCMNT